MDDCILCGEMGVIQARNHDGKPICHKCYEKGRYHDESRHEECHICHEKKPVAARLDGLGPICLNCHQKHFYNPPKKKCYVCGKTKPIKLVTEKGNVCKTCYQREFNKERCTDCQKEKPVAYRREGKVLCRACRKKMRQQEQKGFNISQLRESKLISLVAV
ncbi:hypothetical protein M1307_01115 [Patescibacteria group bacterium]|nr:hypothetical protein [Patescibacteria group bacterium]